MEGVNIDDINNRSQLPGHSGNLNERPLNEALKLLATWHLSQLCNTFKEQEVCTVALQHLTDADICELIPKIGPRAIFRSKLVKWREQMQKHANSAPQSSNYNTVIHANNSIIQNEGADQIIKLEIMDTETEEQWMKDISDMKLLNNHTLRMDSAPSSTASTQHDESESDVAAFREHISQPFDIKSVASNENSVNNRDDIPEQAFSSYDSNIPGQVDIKRILENCPDGRAAIDFYREYKQLDANQRKKIVKHIITVMIENRAPMSVNFFHNLARQIVEMFPNESYSTYYMPRTGVTCPKGALYNKYLNMCKRLRREGLLEYRVQRRAGKSVSHKTRTIQNGSTKNRT